MFEKSSRYYYIDNRTVTLENGSTIVYKARRFIPQPETVPSLTEITADGQRIDQISYATIGAPAFYWKIGDANRVYALTELETSGRKIRIPTNGNNR